MCSITINNNLINIIDPNNIYNNSYTIIVITNSATINYINSETSNITNITVITNTSATSCTSTYHCYAVVATSSGPRIVLVLLLRNHLLAPTG